LRWTIGTSDESGGRPRQFENPAANFEDIKNAATALFLTIG
jgi:hypothetical protein